VVAGGDEVKLRAPFEELIVRARRADEALSNEQRDLARRAALELRFGLENNDPAIRESAGVLDRLLLGAELEGAAAPHPLGATSPFLEERLRRLEAALASHRLVVERVVFSGLVGDEERPPILPDLPPPPRDAKTTSFEVCFVDEIGVALNGLGVEFALSGERLGRTTNAAGVAVLEGATGFSALVVAPEPKSIDEILDPRWKKPEPSEPPVATTRPPTTPATLSRTERPIARDLLACYLWRRWRFRRGCAGWLSASPRSCARAAAPSPSDGPGPSSTLRTHSAAPARC
jgi:hypothetical protein